MESKKTSSGSIPVSNTSSKSAGVLDGVSKISVNNASISSATKAIPVEPAATPVTISPSSGSSPKPALSAPSTQPISVKSKQPKLWTSLLTVLLIVVVLGGIYGVYAWQHKKVTNLTTQVSSLGAQVASLNSKIATLNAAANQPTLTTFQITELGIQFILPNDLQDLTYAVNAAHTSANLSSQTLQDLNSACTAGLTSNNALGMISKATGQFPASSSSMTLIKQFSSYYIAYTKPTSTCSSDSSVDNLITSLSASLKGAFSTISATT